MWLWASHGGTPPLVYFVFDVLASTCFHALISLLEVVAAPAAAVGCGQALEA